MAEESTLLTRRRIVELLAAFDLQPTKGKGQNYVVDPNMIRKIVRVAGVGPGDPVVEIGPGLGSLSLGLLDVGVEWTGVELDERVVPALESVVGSDRRIVVGDARAVDWREVLGGRPHTLVANLPYNVATSLVLDLLVDVPLVTRMVVMVQLEVGERLAAPPGASARGIPSVIVECHGAARVLDTVPPDVFHPRPRVMSALVEITRHDEPAVDAGPLSDLVRRAFGQRRKTLGRSLRDVLDLEAFAVAGVDPQRRPETLSIDEWRALTAVLDTVAG